MVTSLFKSSTPSPQDLETILFRHVVDVWFPKSLDMEYGGFLCDFNRQWQIYGSNAKLLEFQARHTMFAAEASLVYPNHQNLNQAMLHGYQFLSLTWDQEYGGWFHLLDRAGNPLQGSTKHIHGVAYAIQACATVHQVRDDLGALDLALRGFEWLENYAYDRQYGGYFGFFDQAGTRIQDHTEWNIDTIGTPIGFKDINVHSDLLESFTYLYRVCRSPQVGIRLQELIEIIAQKFCQPSGFTFHFCHDNWHPYQGTVRFGYGFQVAYRLLSASEALGNNRKPIELSHQLLNYRFQYGWDQYQGGFFSTMIEPIPNDLYPIEPTKVWWINFEALRALIFMNSLKPDRPLYKHYLSNTWKYIQSHFIDPKYGGIYGNAITGWKIKLGFRSKNITHKGHIWKDCSHEGRALLYWLSVIK